MAQVFPAKANTISRLSLLGGVVLLGVIGLGGIGREVARIGKGMGMNVIGWNRTTHAEIDVPLVDID